MQVDESRAKSLDQRCESADGLCSDSRHSRLTCFPNSPYNLHISDDAPHSRTYSSLNHAQRKSDSAPACQAQHPPIVPHINFEPPVRSIKYHRDALAGMVRHVHLTVLLQLEKSFPLVNVLADFERGDIVGQSMKALCPVPGGFSVQRDASRTRRGAGQGRGVGYCKGVRLEYARPAEDAQEDVLRGLPAGPAVWDVDLWSVMSASMKPMKTYQGRSPVDGHDDRVLDSVAQHTNGKAGISAATFACIAGQERATHS